MILVPGPSVRVGNATGGSPLRRSRSSTARSPSETEKARGCRPPRAFIPWAGLRVCPGSHLRVVRRSRTLRPRRHVLPACRQGALVFGTLERWLPWTTLTQRHGQPTLYRQGHAASMTSSDDCGMGPLRRPTRGALVRASRSALQERELRRRHAAAGQRGAMDRRDCNDQPTSEAHGAGPGCFRCCTFEAAWPAEPVIATLTSILAVGFPRDHSLLRQQTGYRRRANRVPGGVRRLGSHSLQRDRGVSGLLPGRSTDLLECRHFDRCASRTA